ncbi:MULTISPECIES: PIN domain-containing protein [unclassified Microcystis]|jgi:predicted nucleic acid-binding protein|uniref:PIN domain-containing protein n=1 Tax=unclassified Microcystis TaxID=2643300 RepID=UPI002585C0D1|nr:MULTISPECIES: PIN domain-containing protein [unclassified Microcystis]MCA2762594.1 PIN domain-containing protein [Microcystis sp. M151S2]MCU7242257.1 PIN domain-containing protein [Microcystis aeruginosa WS75]MCA2643378.1 PIN domain-containing protein [Microcystis sp. M087S2]MCA2671016.1 PIN domain-containing protein [Microcystis sp. M080S2]MCA2687021.1 PIN domain-containing protein [Microcystis sp. M037S2]
MEKWLVFLLDTNIWLERLLGQGQAEVVAELLDTLSPSDMCITDFTLHSIGVICNRLNQRDVFIKFVDDVLIDAGVVEIIDLFRLDFDDAYQYVAAELEKATIVSFDQDFDKTEQRRLTPMQVLKIRN